MRNSQVAVVCAFLSITLSSCIFSPHKGPGGGGLQPPVYQIPSTPNAVLENLVVAYQHRDSTAYKSLFDENYMGSSLDQLDPSPVLSKYKKVDEAMHIAGLAKSSTISNIVLQLAPAYLVLPSTDDPSWAMVNNPIFSLTIADGQNEWVITGADEDVEFHFISTPDPTSPTGKTWKIVKWVEVRRG